MRFLRIERRMDPAEHDPGPPLARDPSDLIAAQGVARVDAYPDNIPLVDRGRVQNFKSFVSDERIAEAPRRRRGQHVEPAGGDNSHAERKMTRIYQVHLH